MYLSEPAKQALCAHLDVRGTATDDFVFVYRHRPLTPSYCWARTLAPHCGAVQVCGPTAAAAA